MSFTGKVGRDWLERERVHIKVSWLSAEPHDNSLGTSCSGQLYLNVNNFKPITITRDRNTHTQTNIRIRYIKATLSETDTFGTVPDSEVSGLQRDELQ